MEQARAAAAIGPGDEFEPLAAVWATAEEWWGGADVEFLAELVNELRGMARRALADGRDKYCWICL
ncbi:hypothetical protein ACGFIY_01790 [Micromonospora chersina]|uniref:hypothetical protein n=1 Tax=Micromonospora chersina TaxID=47854 RepID=UPI003721993A